jgi:hypothetical protein
MAQWGPGKDRRRASANYWYQPMKWNADAEKNGVRPRVFCGSLCDIFDNAVLEEWRSDEA